MFTAKLRRARRASGAPWVKFLEKSIHARNFDYHVSALAGNSVAALHSETRAFLAGNHISDEQRE